MNNGLTAYLKRFLTLVFFLPAGLSAQPLPLPTLSPSPLSTESPIVEPTTLPVAPPVQVVEQLMVRLNDNLRYVGCVSFLNTSQKLITAIRFDFNLINAFHESSAHFHGDRIGEFSPGVTIAGPANVDQYNVGVGGGSLSGANQKVRNCWNYYVSGSAPQSMTVNVQRVIFADGSEYVNTIDSKSPLDR